MTNKALLELWINCVFAHGGLRKKNNFQRKHFDDAVQKYGIGVLEWNFRSIISSAGINMIVMGFHYVLPFLNQIYTQTGKKESFIRSSPFGRSIQEITQKKDVIYRKASTKFHSEESAEQRLKRVLKRSGHSTIANTLRNIKIPFGEKLMALLKCSDLNTFLTELGGKIHIHETGKLSYQDFKENLLIAGSDFGDNYQIDRYRTLHVTKKNHAQFLQAYTLLKEDFLDTDDRVVKPPKLEPEL